MPREPKKLPMGTRDSALQAGNLPMDTRDKERNPRQMMASCLSKLHSDPMLSIVHFSPLGPQTGSGAAPRTPATPRHSPPLRGRPRDALYYYFLALQQICCHAFLEEQAWCSMGSSSFCFPARLSYYPDVFIFTVNFRRPVRNSPRGVHGKYKNASFSYLR